FFFQAEDGIRDWSVTGVQTCALPIYLQVVREYEELNWNGSFEDYLKIVRENPKVTRTAFQRVYDMILSYGQEEYIDNKKKLIRRSEERRVGKEGRRGWARWHEKKKGE